MTIFQNTDMEIHTICAERSCIVMHNPRLASKLNKVLRIYPEGTRFTAAEPRFPVLTSDLERNLLYAGIPRDIINSITYKLKLGSSQ